MNLSRSILALTLLASIPLSRAASTAGDWDLGSWAYSSGAAPITTSSVSSDGSPSVGLSANYSTSGGTSFDLTGNAGEDGRLTTVGDVAYASGVTKTFDETLTLNLSEAVDFGPAGGQSVDFSSGPSNGFGFYLDTWPSQISAGSVDISLAGGATFADATGSLLGKLELTSGGTGSSFANFTWNPASPASGSHFFIFDGLKINGNLTGITVSQSFTRPGDGTSGSSASTSNFQISSLAPTPVPEPGAVVPLALAGAAFLLRRRKTGSSGNRPALRG